MASTAETKRLPDVERAISPQLVLIANKMAAAVTRCTRDLRYAWANERYAQWIHRPVNEIIGSKIQDVLGNEAFLRLLPYFERVLSGETSAYEEEIAFAGIGKRSLSAIYTPTHDIDGKVDGWVAFIRDITDEKRTQAALLHIDKLLLEEAQALAKLNQCSIRLWQTDDQEQGLSEMLRSVIELLGADKGTIHLLNHERSVLTIAAHHGFEREFLDYFREVSATDDSACGRALRRRELVIIEDIEKDTGFAPHVQIAKVAGFKAVVSSPLAAKDGRVLGTVSTHFGSVHRPTEQQLRRLELYTRQAADFIDRCQREQELRLREERYRKLTETLDTEVHARTADLKKKTAELLQKAALLDLANDAIFVKSANGTISYWNEGATRLYGWTMAEALGRFPAELLNSEYPIPLSEIESRDNWRGEITHSKRDGSRIIVASRWTRIRDSNGNLAGWLEINTDITAHKRSEEAARKLSGRILTLQDEERRRIARGLHDSLGQYLAALKMNLDILSASDGNQSAIAECSNIVEKCMAETRTISYLLHPPLLDEAGLKSALQWFVDGFAQRSEITVNVDLPRELQRFHKDVETTLFRIVQEALTNVHRHSQASEVSIGLGVDQNVRLIIEDNGKGIPDERLRDLESGGGTGVGLAGMRERVRELGGSLSIKSDKEGTTVRVSIPLASAVWEEGSEGGAIRSTSAA